MKIIRNILILVFAVFAFEACKEEERFGISSSDKTVPEAPVIDSVRALHGGARIFYKPLTDIRVLQVVAEFTAANGQVFRTTASFFRDSLDVYGFADTVATTFYLYTESRAGVRSTGVPVTVTPKAPSIRLVHDKIRVGPGFNALYVEWINELQQTVNVFVDLDFRADGQQKSVRLVYSSNRDSVRQFVPDLNLLADEQVKMKISIGDVFGNITEPKDTFLYLLQDSQIAKDNWQLPFSGELVGGVPMMYGTWLEGSNEKLIDGIIDREDGMFNFCHTTDRGRIGMTHFDFPTNAMPVPTPNQWNLIIDLGAYYQLSRIITHQRHSMTAENPRGQLYRDENVGRYALWYLDEEAVDGEESVINGEVVKGSWVRITEHIIPVPIGIQPIEFPRLGLLGDEAYMYPVTPGYTPPVRWFRYEALANFDNNYSGVRNNCLSEVTLFGLGPIQR